MAVVGDDLWVAGMGEDRIWRVAIGGGKACHVVRRERRRHVRVVTEVNRGPGTLKTLRCCLVLPVDKPGQRIVGDIRFEPKPLKVEVDERGQRVARYEAANIPPGGHFQMAWSAEVEFEVRRWAVFPEQAGTLADVPQSIRDLYTRKARRYSMDAAVVRQAAREAVAGETELFWQVRSIHDYVIRRLRYVSPGWRPAAEGLTRGTGVCDDYASLLVALCRLNGIPARVMIGQNHVSAEVYFPGIGHWFPIDPTADDTPGVALWPRCRAFGLSSRIITHIENDAAPGFWKPTWQSDRPGTRVVSQVGELVVPADRPAGPVFSGISRIEDKGRGKPLLVEWPPAFDADGHLPLRYEVYLLPSAAPARDAKPTLTTAETRCELSGLKSGSACFVRVVPVNAKGRRHAAALQDVAFARRIRKK
ncbi:transglutaminase domain-containing protein [Planctomycetota bacterium]